MSAYNTEMTTSTTSNYPFLVAASAEELELLRFLRAGQEMEETGIPTASLRGIPIPTESTPKCPSGKLLGYGKLHIREEDWTLCEAVNKEVREHHLQYDNSHNYEHIQRVCTIGLQLYEEEMKTNPNWANTLDTTTLFLSLMVHDVGDQKYCKPGEIGEVKTKDLLTKAGASPELASRIWTIADTVSYTAETKNPGRVVDTINQYPELAIVQDSDRLDSLGTIGMARCFTFGGANEVRAKQTIGRTSQLMWLRFADCLHRMKTEAGKKEAWKRWPEMVAMWRWFVRQTDVSSVLPSPVKDGDEK